MRALILLHSATGNTRLVARYAARHLDRLGIDCDVHDVLDHSQPPSLEGVDLFGVAFPVMVFRPTLALERVLDQMERPRAGLPAFALATAAGDPGGALHVACDKLDDLGFVPIDAHWVISPSNFPSHVNAARKLESLPGVGSLNRRAEALGRMAWKRIPDLRPALGTLWLDASEPDERDREELDRFLDGVAGAFLAFCAGARIWPVDLSGKGSAPLAAIGRRRSAEMLEASIRGIGLKADPDACTGCNACVETCPARCIFREGDGPPRFGPGCTGCYACYNHCAHGAISAVLSPKGGGRYAGPPRSMRTLFTDKA